MSTGRSVRLRWQGRSGPDQLPGGTLRVLAIALCVSLCSLLTVSAAHRAVISENGGEGRGGKQARKRGLRARWGRSLLSAVKWCSFERGRITGRDRTTIRAAH